MPKGAMVDKDAGYYRTFPSKTGECALSATDASTRVAGRRGLRFDQVALRLIAQLQASLRDYVPEGKTLLVTVSAPIRFPSKTAAAIEKEVRLWLEDASRPVEFNTEMNGNQIRVRVVRSTSDRSSNVAGFVHNPHVDLTALLDAVQAALNR